MTRVLLHIDRLSLPAMTPAEQRALLQALQEGLQTRLASVPAQAWNACATHCTPRPQVLTGASGAAMGRELAQAIVQALQMAQ
ncbi:hypothetical protein [Alicycliphilus denitrificans]|uniref:hypothetical protein n=1 Tax=Alicycliphilus denitrificans TaxID=179636 RepID=UPI003850A40D